MTRARAVLPCALALAAGVAAVTSMAAPAVTGAQACAAPEYRQFDFWLGDWDVFDRETQKQVARARVSSILGGCVLLEEYDDLENHGGRKSTRLNSSHPS